MSSEVYIDMYIVSGEGTLIDPRCNDTAMEIMQVTSGEIALQVGTDFITVREGDIVYIPASMMLRASAASSYASLRGVVFDASVLEGGMENFDTEVISMFYIRSKNNISVFTSESSLSGIISKYMDAAQDEYMSKELCYKLNIKAYIFLMMSALLRDYSNARNERDRMIYHNVKRLLPVIDYISAHFEEKIYIDSLADIINVSSDYFIKIFKDSIGKTPIDYINGLRINKSMQYLTRTDMPVSEISDKIGFCNANYFHKIFKQYTDTSPLAYRKSAR